MPGFPTFVNIADLAKRASAELTATLDDYGARLDATIKTQESGDLDTYLGGISKMVSRLQPPQPQQPAVPAAPPAAPSPSIADQAGSTLQGYFDQLGAKLGIGGQGVSPQAEATGQQYAQGPEAGGQTEDLGAYMDKLGSKLGEWGQQAGQAAGNLGQQVTAEPTLEDLGQQTKANVGAAVRREPMPTGLDGQPDWRGYLGQLETERRQKAQEPGSFGYTADQAAARLGDMLAQETPAMQQFEAQGGKRPTAADLNPSQRAWQRGIGSVIENTGQVLNWQGLPEIGGAVQRAGQGIRAGYAENDPFTWNEQDFFANLANPRFYSEFLVENAPFTLSLIPLAILAGKGGSAAAAKAMLGPKMTSVVEYLSAGVGSRVMESAMEAGQVYDQALTEGKTEPEAKRAADTTFALNIPLSIPDAAQFALSFSKLPAPAKTVLGRGIVQRLGRPGVGVLRVLGVMGSEGLEEVAQQAAQQYSLGKPITWDSQMQQSFAAGAAMGAGMGGPGVIYSAARGEQPNAPDRPDVSISESAQRLAGQLPAPGLTVKDVAPPPATAQGAKQPWEMTRAEFNAAENAPRVAAIQQAIREGKSIIVATYQRATQLTKPEYIRMTADGTVQIPEGKRWVALTDDLLANTAAQAGIKPVPFGERVYHRTAVEDALARGDPVPASVLADYPDLAAKVVSSPATVKQPWQMTKAEFISQAKVKLNKSFLPPGHGFGTELGFERQAAIAHRQKVSEAFSRGDAVPQAVLDEYGLAPKATALVPETAPLSPGAVAEATVAGTVQLEKVASLISVNLNDVSYERAVRAYNGVSWEPERRAGTVQGEYVTHMQEVEAKLAPLAKTPEQVDKLRQGLQQYKQDYLVHLNAYLDAKSRVVSSFITGASNFPVRQMEKRGATEDKRLNEWMEWSKKAQKALRQDVAPETSRIISSDNPEAIALLQKKIDKANELHRVMVAANKIVRDKKLTGGQQIERLVELGISRPTASDLLKPDFAGRIGFADYEMKNNSAELRRLQGRVEELTRSQVVPSAEWTIDGGKIIDNADENRIQIVFDTKPDEAMRENLRANGFKWAPSQGAWQRQRTDNARGTIQRLFPDAKAIESEALAPDFIKPQSLDEMDAGPQTGETLSPAEPYTVTAPDLVPEVPPVVAETAAANTITVSDVREAGEFGVTVPAAPNVVGRETEVTSADPEFADYGRPVEVTEFNGEVRQGTINRTLQSSSGKPVYEVDFGSDQHGRIISRVSRNGEVRFLDEQATATGVPTTITAGGVEAIPATSTTPQPYDAVKLEAVFERGRASSPDDAHPSFRNAHGLAAVMQARGIDTDPMKMFSWWQQELTDVSHNTLPAIAKAIDYTIGVRLKDAQGKDAYAYRDVGESAIRLAWDKLQDPDTEAWATDRPNPFMQSVESRADAAIKKANPGLTKSSKQYKEMLPQVTAAVRLQMMREQVKLAEQARGELTTHEGNAGSRYDTIAKKVDEWRREANSWRFQAEQLRALQGEESATANAAEDRATVIGKKAGDLQERYDGALADLQKYADRLNEKIVAERPPVGDQATELAIVAKMDLIKPTKNSKGDFERMLAAKLLGVDGWSNGVIFEAGEPPFGLQYEEGHGPENRPALDRHVQVANWHPVEAKAVLAAADGAMPAVILANADESTVAIIQGRYYGYFAKKYPSLAFEAKDGDTAVLVQQNGKIVGMIMPLGSGDLAGRARELLAEVKTAQQVPAPTPAVPAVEATGPTTIAAPTTQPEQAAPPVEAAAVSTIAAPQAGQPETAQPLTTRAVTSARANQMGLSKQQGQYLAGELEKAAEMSLPIRLDAGEVQRARESQRPEQRVEIKVPDDGKITVYSAEQANALHKILTGQPIVGFEGVKTPPRPTGNTGFTETFSAIEDADEIMRLYGEPDKAAVVLERQFEWAKQDEATTPPPQRQQQIRQVIDLLKERATGWQTNTGIKGSPKQAYDVAKELKALREKSMWQAPMETVAEPQATIAAPKQATEPTVTEPAAPEQIEVGDLIRTRYSGTPLEVIGAGSIKYGKKDLPGYKVRTANGGEDFIAADGAILVRKGTPAPSAEPAPTQASVTAPEMLAEQPTTPTEPAPTTPSALTPQQTERLQLVKDKLAEGRQPWTGIEVYRRGADVLVRRLVKGGGELSTVYFPSGQALQHKGELTGWEKVEEVMVPGVSREPPPGYSKIVGKGGVVEIGPTAYEEAAAKEAAKSPAQRKQVARRQLKTMLNSFLGLSQQQTAGSQYNKLQEIQSFARESDLENDLPPWFNTQLRLHEHRRVNLPQPEVVPVQQPAAQVQAVPTPQPVTPPTQPAAPAAVTEQPPTPGARQVAGTLPVTPPPTEAGQGGTPPSPPRPPVSTQPPGGEREGPVKGASAAQQQQVGLIRQALKNKQLKGYRLYSDKNGNFYVERTSNAGNAGWYRMNKNGLLSTFRGKGAAQAWTLVEEAERELPPPKAPRPAPPQTPVDDLARVEQALAVPKKSIKDSFAGSWDRLLRELYDRNYPFKGLERRTGIPVHMLAQIVPGSVAAGESYVIQFVQPEIAKVGSDVSWLEKYMVAWRMKDLKDLNPEAALPGAVQDPAHALDQILQQIGQVRWDKIVDVADTLWALNDKLVLQPFLANGILNQEGYQAIRDRWPHYIPFYRQGFDLETTLRTMPPASAASLGEQVIKRLSEDGSERGLLHPLAHWQAQVVKTRESIARNDAAKAVRDGLAELGRQDGTEYVTDKEQHGADWGTIRLYENGQHMTYWVPSLYAVVAKGMESESANLFSTVIRKMALPLRAGAVTYNPAFLVVNPVRDAFSAWFREGLVPFSPVVIRSWLATIGKTQTWHEAARAGVLMSGITEIAKETGTMARVDRLGGIKIENPADVLLLVPRLIAKANEISEQTTRVAVYQKLHAQGITELEAAVRARDATVDFAKAGNFIKLMNTAIPFLNAGVQGSANTLRTIKDNPAKAFLYGLPLGLASILFAVWNHRDDYEEVVDLIPDYEYLNNWVVIVGVGTKERDPQHPGAKPEKFPIYVKIPKGPMGAFLTAPAEALSRIAWNRGDRQTAEIVQEAGGNMLMAMLPFEPAVTGITPPVISTAYGLASGRDFFRDQPIVPESEQTRPAPLQYGRDTSRTAVWLGEQTGRSPRLWEFAITDLMAGGARTAMWLLDLGLEAVHYQPITPGEAKQQPLSETEQISRNPIVGRFVGTRNTRLESRAWDEYDKALSESRNKFAALPEPRRLGINLGEAGYSIKNVELEPAERAQLQRLVGDKIEEAVKRTTGIPVYASLSDANKKKLLGMAMDQARQQAAGAFLMQLGGETIRERLTATAGAMQ